MQFNIFKHVPVLPGVRGLSSASNSSQGYIPRGPQNVNSGGSAKPGGSQEEPSTSGTESGGHITATSQGSATPGGRRPSGSE
ncbi:uncharacterized protein EV420DRAFT_1634794 [Desarmillaria tabescens]|uniref:Uncharacterized protein n=1 Tax=Armillaria tabescens TaxID=1929756 RepID=A0AA39NRA4_ARMTA|nr:uncharacterized protein EV420DRAFT_1634794 [Desarmillaria tabescens]KAK0470371.1 hypothetical protein EV420DRAFT_1634794 [Desarmillaria tabescens]